MHNKISLRTLFVLITGSAFVAALFRNLHSNQAVVTLAAIVAIILATFAMYAIVFLIAYPLGRINKYFIDQTDEGESPFATDRLPKQIVAPTNKLGGE